ncbi:MAG: peptidylprolyl isomerase [candidate division Zixibacteria bacterium]|nr:peptidylprolyl isomerase [candidate division Zixibacteria bacterium]
MTTMEFGKTLVLVIGCLLTATCSWGQREPVDKIAAIVGNKVILASEVAGQVQMIALQSGQQPRNEEELLQLKNDVLEQMVSDRLFLVAAEKDTSISLRPEEIDRALEEQVARVSQNFGSNDDFLAALAAEGLTLRDLKKQYRGDIEGQLLKQRFISKRLQTVSVSRHETESFFHDFKDSISSQPEAVKLAHILIRIEPSQQVEDSVEANATKLRQLVLDGADFAAISAQHSSLGAGASGGDLGYIARDDVVPEFARAAFSLSVGDISGVIRTQFGYHVIKCEGKRDDRLWLRHILLSVVPGTDDTLRAHKLVDSLIGEANGGGDFEALAKAFSTDNTTRAQGGELGWFAAEELPVEFASEIRGWSTPGEQRGPIISQFGLHILRLLDYQAERQFNLEDDFDELKQLARQEKTSRLIEEWVDEIKSHTYIEYRLE